MSADLKLLNKFFQQCEWQYIIDNTDNIENTTMNFTEKIYVIHT
jgi:hypothetical protein